MIRSDFHVHSSFSGDSTEKMENTIHYAIYNKIENLCFTEHHDLDLPKIPLKMLLDFEAYQKHFFMLKEKLGDKINLLFGIEIGIQPHLYAILKDIVNRYPFDFVLCSNHVVGGMDPYYPEFFEGKTQKQSYLQCFEDILNNVRSFDSYDIFGHLDYMIRYAPYEDKHYLYESYQEVLDEILKTIIQKGKGIELNTSGFKYQLNDSHPSFQVINRYKELGGEIITIGSDAHKKEQVQNYFDLAQDILTTAGFKYYTIFEKRKPIMIPL